MTDKEHVFAQTRRMYLETITTMDKQRLTAVDGIDLADGLIRLPFFDRPLHVRENDITRADGTSLPFEVQVVVARYLLMCEKEVPPEKDWTAFRDFKDAGPLTVYFADNVEGLITSSFSGRRKALEEACLQHGAKLAGQAFTYDVAKVFTALPRLPVLLVFNDRDDDFPASCSVLFKANADALLDPESLAILGAILAGKLSSTLA